MVIIPFLLFCVLSSSKPAAAAFLLHENVISPTPKSSITKTTTSTSVFGRKGRGSLWKEVTPDENRSSTTKKKKKEKRSSNKSKTTGEVGVSNKLAAWAKTIEGSQPEDTIIKNEEEEEEEEKTTFDDDATTTFSRFEPSNDDDINETEDDDLVTNKKKRRKDTKNKRRERQSKRREQELARKTAMRSIISSLESTLDIDDDDDDNNNKKKKKSKNRDMETILSQIRDLVSIGSEDEGNSNLRGLFSSQKTRDYRLAWVGSDESVCHLGTGLHKVPLARLQEIFMTTGKNRIQILEIIRILGPFPNVRNTLQGDIRLIKPKLDQSARLSITYDSMIDGTGKEILAGTEDNVRMVDLDVVFGDEEVIVCVVPQDKDQDFLSGQGSRVLLFFSEGNLQDKLKVLRAD